MLFKDINTLKQYAQITSADLNSIRITMQSVEQKYLLPVLGKELFNSFTQLYKAAPNDTAFTASQINADLLDRCRKVTAPMFCYVYAAKADVQVSDSGVQRAETGNNKTAYQYQNTNYREANFAEGEDAIESLIAFLEDNADNYPTWATSAEFTKYRSLFIKTAAEFNDLYPSHTPYRNFWAMRPKMTEVEELSIRSLLGDTLFDALKAKALLQVPNFTEPEKSLLGRIKKAIAYLTVASSVPYLSIRLDAGGITVSAPANFSTNDKENTRGGADNRAIADLINSCNMQAKVWLDNATQYLRDHQDIFTTWIGVEQPAKPAPSFNKKSKSVFGLH